MLAGLPIPARLFDRDVLISPLTIRDIQALNIHMRQLYLTEHISLLDGTPPDVRKQVVADLYEKARSMSIEHGDGQLFLFTNVDAFCMVLVAYCVKSNPPLAEDWIKEKCCVLNQVTLPSVALLKEIQTAITVSYPKQQDLPKKNESELAKFFDDPDAEAMVRLFRGLAERYHFSMEQIMNMTAFQIHNFLFLLPEEVRRILEMDADIQRMRGNQNAPGQQHTASPPPGSGVVQMDVASYNAWKMQFDAKRRQESSE
jgi:hypothetical protein